MSTTKNFRKKLDLLIQNAQAIRDSSETSLAWRALQLAKAWLGKALGYQGNANPYPEVDSVDKIPPTADVADSAPTMPSSDYLHDINTMRANIGDVIDQIEGVIPAEERQAHCYRKCLDCLTEARFWYGFELQRIREYELLSTEVRNLSGEFMNLGSELSTTQTTPQDSADEESPFEAPPADPFNSPENENDDSKKKTTRNF